MITPAAGGDVEQHRRRPVGERLRARPGGLRLLDQPLDAGQRGLLADRRRPVTRIAESVATVPATTRSPGRFGTGRDSPVIIDSSSSASPSSTTTVRRHPTARSGPARGRRRADRPAAPARPRRPAPIRSASSGSSAASAASAPRAWPIARISSQWPSSMITTRSASSHQKSRSRPPRPSEVAALATNATVIASAIEQHHARLPGPDLGRRAGQERPPAVAEDDRAEHRRDPAGAVRERVAEQVGEHARERDHGDGEQQAPPEAVPEPRRVIPVSAVVAHRASSSSDATRDSEISSRRQCSSSGSGNRSASR